MEKLKCKGASGMGWAGASGSHWEKCDLAHSPRSGWWGSVLSSSCPLEMTGAKGIGPERGDLVEKGQGSELPWWSDLVFIWTRGAEQAPDPGVPGTLGTPWNPNLIPLQMSTEFLQRRGLFQVLGASALLVLLSGNAGSEVAISHAHHSGLSPRSGKGRWHREAGLCHSEEPGARPAHTWVGLPALPLTSV